MQKFNKIVFMASVKKTQKKTLVGLPVYAPAIYALFLSTIYKDVCSVYDLCHFSSRQYFLTI